MILKFKKIIKKISWIWKNFWGSIYRVYEDDKKIKEILIYHKRIYLLNNKK